MARPTGVRVPLEQQRERRRIYNKLWRERNVEKVRAQGLAAENRYRARHPDRIKLNRKRQWEKVKSDPVKRAHISAKRKVQWLRLQYGITPAEREALFDAQGRRCAICRTAKPERHWTVDHCHITGQVRGILCNLCNAGLGLFADQLLVVQAAAKYLHDRTTD